jgi:hypothetical protein
MLGVPQTLEKRKITCFSRKSNPSHPVLSPSLYGLSYLDFLVLLHNQPKVPNNTGCSKLRLTVDSCGRHGACPIISAVHDQEVQSSGQALCCGLQSHWFPHLLRFMFISEYRRC